MQQKSSLPRRNTGGVMVSGAKCPAALDFLIRRACIVVGDAYPDLKQNKTNNKGGIQ
jgi:hypothetical protein